MRSLAGSLADGVLADAILVPPRPLIPPTNIRKVRGLWKLYNEKGWLNTSSLRSTETRDELSTALYLNEIYIKMPVSA